MDHKQIVNLNNVGSFKVCSHEATPLKKKYGYDSLDYQLRLLQRHTIYRYKDIYHEYNARNTNLMSVNSSHKSKHSLTQHQILWLSLRELRAIINNNYYYMCTPQWFTVEC